MGEKGREARLVKVDVIRSRVNTSSPLSFSQVKGGTNDDVGV